jgi:hypothetical protein
VVGMEPHPYATQMDEERKRIRATPEYAAHRTRRARATLQMADRLPSLPGQVPMSKSLGYLQLHDLVHALQAEGAAWPGLVEESLAKEASSLVSEFWCFCFHNDNVLRYSLWPLMAEIGDNIERALPGRAGALTSCSRASAYGSNISSQLDRHLPLRLWFSSPDTTPPSCRCSRPSDASRLATGRPMLPRLPLSFWRTQQSLLPPPSTRDSSCAFATTALLFGYPARQPTACGPWRASAATGANSSPRLRLPTVPCQRPRYKRAA